MNLMKITVIGTGRNEIVTGICHSRLGHHVTLLPLRSGFSWQNLGEPGLAELATESLAHDRLVIESDVNRALETADLIVASSDLASPNAALSDLQNQCRLVAKTVRTKTPLVLIQRVESLGFMQELCASFDVMPRPLRFAFSPADFSPGRSVDECLSPAEIIIGADHASDQTMLEQLFSPFISDGGRICVLSVRKAEFVSLLRQAERAAQARLVAEIQKLADEFDVTTNFIYSATKSQSSRPKQAAWASLLQESATQDLPLLSAAVPFQGS